MADSESETRVKLLNAAGEVFAEHGFRDATVREICQRAQTNIAAVNYHFGSKEELYRQLLLYAHRQSMERYPLRTDPAAPVETQLGEFILTTLLRMLDEGKPAWHGKLMAMEMADPTGALEDVAAQFMRPHFELLVGLLSSLAGPRVPPERLTLLALSVVAETAFYKMCAEAIRRVVPGHLDDPAKIPVIARHVTQVMLAAARAVREEFQGVQPDGGGVG